MSRRPRRVPSSSALASLAAVVAAPAVGRAEARYAIVPHAHGELCAEVAGAPPDPGAPVWLAWCAGNGAQAWQLAGGAVRTADALCLEVTDGVDRDGTTLQVGRCDAANGNQHFERAGDLLRWTGHQRCVDVARGRFRADTRLGIWRCNADNDNQRFALRPSDPAAAAAEADAQAPQANLPPPAPAAPRDAAAEGDDAATAATEGARSAPSGVVEHWPEHAPSAAHPRRRRPGAPAGSRLQSAGTFLGVRYVSLASFLNRHPVLKPLRRDLIDAARSVEPPLPPTLLAAMAMEASGGNPDAVGGLMQFRTPEAWAAYGQGDLNDGRDSLFAAARCLGAWLSERDDDLAAALRAYDAGANPNYPDEIRAWLVGGAPRLDGL